MIPRGNPHNGLESIHTHLSKPNLRHLGSLATLMMQNITFDVVLNVLINNLAIKERKMNIRKPKNIFRNPL